MAGVAMPLVFGFALLQGAANGVLTILRPLLVAHGFDANVADRGMLMAAETYAANLEEAVSRGVFGVPFFVVDDQKFWGQDRLDDQDLYLAGKL